MNRLPEMYARFLDVDFCPDLEFLFLAPDLLEGAAKIRPVLEAPAQETLDEILQRIAHRAKRIDQDYLSFSDEDKQTRSAWDDFKFIYPWGAPMTSSLCAPTKNASDPSMDDLLAATGLSIEDVHQNREERITDIRVWLERTPTDAPVDPYASACARIMATYGSELSFTLSRIVIPEHRAFLLRANGIARAAEHATLQAKRQEYVVDLHAMTDAIQTMRDAYGSTPEADSVYHLGLVVQILYFRALERTQQS